MPKQTFYNLSLEKREKIERVALEAFADKDYRDVHVTAIIEQAGISDGSFYQYFTDKKDLFLHMLEAIKQEKISFMQSKNANGRARGESFFNIIKAAVYNGIRFGLERPLHMRFLDRMFESPIKDVAIEEVKQAALNYWKGMIEQGITTGELRKDISVELLSRALAASSIELSRYIVDESGLKQLNEKNEDRNCLEQELREFAEQFAGLFRDGLKKR